MMHSDELTKTVTTDHKNDDRTKTVPILMTKLETEPKKMMEPHRQRIPITDWISYRQQQKKKEPQLTKSASTAMMPMGIRQMSKTQRLDRQNPILMMQRTA